MKIPRFRSLRSRLICIFLALIVLPLGGLGILLFRMQRQITESYLEESTVESAAQLSDLLSHALFGVRSASNLFYMDETLKDELSPASAKTPDAAVLRQLSAKYNTCMSRLSGDVFFLTPDGTYGAASPVSLPTLAELKTRIDMGSGNVTWLSGCDLESGSDTSVYAVRPLHDHDTWEQLGVLLIAVQESELWKACSGYLVGTQNAYLLDRNGNLLTCVNNQGIDYAPDPDRCSLSSGLFREEAAGTEQLVVYNTIKEGGWVLVISSDLDALREPYNASSRTFLLILAVYFVLAVILSIVLTDRFVRPIRQLRDTIDLVQEGDLDAVAPVTSHDEVGQLSEHYNLMLARIRELLNRLMDEQQSRHEAEMQALQAQINPHFIYNALASIRFLVFSQRNQEADHALLALVNILRGTLSNPHELSTVGQEMKLLEDYIELQRISFSRPLTVEFDVDPGISACRICKLTLQPIVENAFVHGFEPGQEECRLFIQAKERDGQVEIAISDNGIGYDTTKPRPAAREGERLHTGLGIENVHERIQLAFGEQYGLKTVSAPGQGTTVTVIIPNTRAEGGALVYDSSDIG